MDMNTEIPRNALSVYNQDNGMDDFPVLKAFQQYIDAEQSKARKRMVSLCIFFGILMTIVIAIFMYMLRETSVRNQQLNDRLVEYAMRDRQPVVMPAPQPAAETTSASEAAMRAMTDTLVAMQKQIAEQQQRAMTQATAPVVAPPPQQQLEVQPAQSVDEMELERKTREAEEKLRRARALLDAEKKKLAEDREKLRQEEIERHRRRLYPEYYAEKERAEAEAAANNGVSQQVVQPQTQQMQQQPPAVRKQLSDDDIADILREADAHISDASAEEDIDDDMEDAIEYFKDDEHTSAPVDAKEKGTSQKWHVPLD